MLNLQFVIESGNKKGYLKLAGLVSRMATNLSDGKLIRVNPCNPRSFVFNIAEGHTGIYYPRIFTNGHEFE